MKVGDLICIPAHRYKVLWTNGIIGDVSDYYVKSAIGLEVINGTRLDSKVD